ncbi:hypothetical protein BC827DRAFT_1387338 [Russula dissimulans]|nr:hypothetical protein BC827DRAFT_1159405 [Russula dissimulans]KAH9953197.1 hypothetical protein BC827DRAFT_1387338 [Russula dissimulans]
MRRGGRRGSRMWYAVEARPIDGTCGVTSALMGIERCESERRRSRSDALSGGPAPVPERVEDGARTREDVREEYVPVLCAFVLGGAVMATERKGERVWIVSEVDTGFLGIVDKGIKYQLEDVGKEEPEHERLTRNIAWKRQSRVLALSGCSPLRLSFDKRL